MKHRRNDHLLTRTLGWKERRARVRTVTPSRPVLAIMLLALFSLGLAGGPSSVTAALQRRRAPQRISEQAVLQISALMEEKLSRTPAQRKLDSHLHYAAKLSRGEQLAPGVSSLESVSARVKMDDRNLVLVDVKADVTPMVLDGIREMGGEVISSFPSYRAIRARMPLAALENLAELPDVQYIGPEEEFMMNRTDLAAAALPSRSARAAEIQSQLAVALPKVMRSATRSAGVRATSSRNAGMAFIGSATSQGDHAHQADTARATFGISGSGVKIGVLSDGVDTRAARIATGDLPAGLTVLAGQAGTGDEGTAMLEIVFDLAPGAQLFFATALGGSANFANNIIGLRTAGCDIIVDDFTYFAEGVYQDGSISQAVNTVTSAGALYFSDAANSGNKSDNQSGTWEGDFVNSGQTIGAVPAGAGIVHSFGGGNVSNQLTVGSSCAPNCGSGLKWSDPLGASTNDYDLYVLDSGLTTVVDSSTGFQTGTQDPFEFVSPPVAGRRFVITLFSGSARALHLSTNRGRLAINTAGAIYGHNAAAAAYTVAAADVRTVGGGVFTTANVVETYSSDGPRRMFYNPNGTPITAGNFLIGTNGGTVLAKDDITAADCGVTTTPGFTTFCGTSAAAPTAAAIAALVKSRKPTATPAEIRAALTSTALDIEAPGFDRDAGFGIVNALAAVTAINSGGNDTIGLYNPVASSFFLRNSNSSAPADLVFGYGPAGAGWIPTSGDWNGDGIDTIGLYNPAASFFFLRNANSTAPADLVFSYGPAGAGWIPISGDWNGDGIDTIGLYNPAASTFFLRNSNTSGPADLVFSYGPAGAGWLPVAGDWNGDGVDTIGLYNPATSTFFLRNANSSAPADLVFAYGPAGAGWIPIVGDWNGDGTDTIGLYNPAGSTFFLRNTNSSAPADLTFAYGPAGAGWKPIVGDWDGL